MKEIRIFKNTNNVCLVTEVNDFIKNNKFKIKELQYSSNTGGLFTTEYSVMVVIEEEKI
ncbi:MULTISPECIES: hypothetical protein [Clostridium]|uniref:Sporulation protein Cse60 n=1 Tax=Clostridium frigoriphilum TaxID=443253 RepID=A0ABU7ULZ4_9CLOT|nr:hypothetical protein [Clostridium sp. DSM 17811]MBU3099755.1 hypothetical protein [Clostridium sp. DSM 17811]